MNPIIVRNEREYKSILQNQTLNKDGRWVPGIPMHKIFDRIKAAIVVLKGNGFVIDVGDYD